MVSEPRGVLECIKVDGIRFFTPSNIFWLVLLAALFSVAGFYSWKGLLKLDVQRDAFWFTFLTTANVISLQLLGLCAYFFVKTPVKSGKNSGGQRPR